jgi:hypothetical protein
VSQPASSYYSATDARLALIQNRFVAVLFIDALQRMVRIAQEGAAAKAKQDMADVRTETN